MSMTELSNPDLAPVPLEERTWGMGTIAALWVGMAVCITTYNIAAGMISQGMTWWQAVITVALGNLIVCVPMILNAHPGTKYGIPFPVLLRASFGTKGANIPAVMRGLVACGWFGIQTWIGGSAIYMLHAVIFKFTPATAADALPFVGISAGQLGCFLLFWVVNIVFILIGTDSIKWLERLAAPFLIAVGLLMMLWFVSKAGGWGIVLSDATTAKLHDGKDVNFWKLFFPNLTAMVGYWATLSLNIPDFSRYAKSQRDQVVGQLAGLPPTMTLYSFIGITVACASIIIYGEAIWDPVLLLSKFESPFVVGFALFALTIATLTTNIAANVVSPANDFSNLAPRYISFKMGGMITGVIGILIMPWKLISDLGAYIFTWLIGYSALLGSIAGVMLVDYYLIRRRELDVDALYDPKGRYSYGTGFNVAAIAAMIVGIVPNVMGFFRKLQYGDALVTPSLSENPFLHISDTIYNYAWFVSLAVAGLCYYILTPKSEFTSQGATLH